MIVSFIELIGCTHGGEKERAEWARGVHAPRATGQEDPQREAAAVPEKEPPGDPHRVRRACGRRARDGGAARGAHSRADDLLRLPRRDATEDAEDDHPAAGGLQPGLWGGQPGHALAGQARGHRGLLLSGDHPHSLGHRCGARLHHQTRRGSRSPEHQRPRAGEREHQQGDSRLLPRLGQVLRYTLNQTNSMQHFLPAEVMH